MSRLWVACEAFISPIILYEKDYEIHAKGQERFSVLEKFKIYLKFYFSIKKKVLGNKCQEQILRIVI